MDHRFARWCVFVLAFPVDFDSPIDLSWFEEIKNPQASFNKEAVLAAINELTELIHQDGAEEDVRTCCKKLGLAISEQRKDSS